MMLDFLLNNLVIFLLVFLRVLALFFAAPVLNDSSVPNKVRILMAVFFSYIILMFVHPKVDLTNLSIWFLAASAIKEIVIGLIIGFFTYIIFWGISFAGSLMGFDLGLSIAELISPNLDLNADVVSMIFYVFTLLIFVMIDGPEYLIRSIYYSFKIIPVTKINLTNITEGLIIAESAKVFVVAVKIAAPILITFLLFDIAESIMSRIIPQMQVFFVLYPVRMWLGFVLISGSMVFFFFTIRNLLQMNEENLIRLINSMG